MTEEKHKPVSLAQIFGYALGEGAVSITMNGISNFVMLFYTQVLGLSAAYAGIALSITMFWDAVTDPVMGHITDNTRSRYGRRHPYLLWGGPALADCEPIDLEFKWFDHMPEPLTILDFQDHGDTAPNNRFRYVWEK